MKTTYNNLRNSTLNISRISWGAIIAGALTALTIVFMLNLLGLGIGFSTIDPMTESDPLDGLGTGSIIWLVVSNLVALFVGGLVAGKMSGFTLNSDGGLHGFLAWALYSIVSFYLITSAIGAVISGMSSAVSSLTGSSQNDKVTVILDDARKKSMDNTTLSYNDIKQEAFQLIKQGQRYNVLPDDALDNTKDLINETEADSKELVNDLNLDEKVDAFINDISFDLNDDGDLKITVDGNEDFIDKQELKEYLADNTQLTEDEINGVITKWDRKIENAVTKAENYYAKAKKKAAKYSEETAEVLAEISITLFIVLFLGALAAFLGGTTGAPLNITAEQKEEEEELY